MKHISGTILVCQECGSEVIGVWHRDDLISRDGCFCLRCKTIRDAKQKADAEKERVKDLARRGL